MRTVECPHVVHDDSKVFAGCMLFMDTTKFEMEVCQECMPLMMNRIDDYLGKATSERSSMLWTHDEHGVMRGVYYSPKHHKERWDADRRREAYEIVQADLLRAGIRILHVDDADTGDHIFCAFVTDGPDVPGAEPAQSLLTSIDAVLAYREANKT